MSLWLVADFVSVATYTSRPRFGREDKVRPQHRELRALLFSNSEWVSFTSSRIVNNEELRDGAYGLSSLSEKTIKCNHLQM